jgi:hypothetical protein
LRKLAASEASGNIGKYRAAIRKGHLERLTSESGLTPQANTLPRITLGAPPVPMNTQILHHNGQRAGTKGQVHILLAYYPRPKIQQLYPIVFEDILKEKISTLPVITK